MKPIIHFIFYLTLLLITSCGGGSSSGTDNQKSSATTTEVLTNIELNQYNADLNFTEDNITTQEVEVKASFQGDGVIVGYAPGELERTWIDIEHTSPENNEITFKIKVSPFGIRVGTYQIDLRFVTGSLDGSNVVYKTLTLNIVIHRKFSISYGQPGVKELLFYSVGNGSESYQPKSGNRFLILGVDSNWIIESDVSWLTFDQTEGTGINWIKVYLRPEYLPKELGEHVAEISVTDKNTDKTEIVNVVYHAKPINTGIATNSTNVVAVREYKDALVSKEKYKIYMTDEWAPRLYILSLESLSKTKYFELGHYPTSSTLSDDGQTILIAFPHENHATYRGGIYEFDIDSESIINILPLSDIRPAKVIPLGADKLVVIGETKVTRGDSMYDNAIEIGRAHV